MLPSLVLQLVIDVLFVTLLVWVYLQQKKQPLHGSYRAPNQSNEGGVKWEDMVQKFQQMQDRVEKDLANMQDLHNRIARLVEQGVLTSAIFPSSLEERELKTVMEKKERIEEIPSVKGIEMVKERLKRDPQYDLKTLLQDQLA